ncbi:MAG: C-terminal binding protein [Haloarculaceae archaeon]
METVASDDPMIDAERIAGELGETASVRTADMTTVEGTIEAARDAEALVVGVRTPVTDAVLDACESLGVVARAGVGIDNIDVGAAAERGVVVTNVPDYCTDEVATHTVAFALACARSLGQYDRDVRAGGWDFRAGGEVHRVQGATVGFLSFGPIARRVREQLRGFDVTALAHDPYVDAGEMADHDVEKVPYEGLLDRSAVLSVNAPLTDETRNMVDADAFARLPDHAVVVNTGRGGVVDEDALVAALDAGEIAAAGLDVLAEEPPTDSPLFDRDDVFLSPHAAWYSVEARRDLNESVAANLRAVANGETPPDRIDPDLDWA